MSRRNGMGAIVVAVGCLASSCGDAPATERATPSTSSTSSTSSSTSSTSQATTPTSAPQGGLEGEDGFVRSVVGATYGRAAAAGATAHQASDFGTKGSWTLFTVEHDGHWYAFTTKNVAGVGMLSDESEVATGERLRDLPEGHWYGVSGIVRDGRDIGGVMLQGRGDDREADGTFPAVDAWHVNLQTLRLEHTSIAGLDVIESCG